MQLFSLLRQPFCVEAFKLNSSEVLPLPLYHFHVCGSVCTSFNSREAREQAYDVTLDTAYNWVCAVRTRLRSRLCTCCVCASVAKLPALLVCGLCAICSLSIAFDGTDTHTHTQTLTHIYTPTHIHIHRQTQTQTQIDQLRHRVTNIVIHTHRQRETKTFNFRPVDLDKFFSFNK